MDAVLICARHLDNTVKGCNMTFKDCNLALLFPQEAENEHATGDQT